MIPRSLAAPRAAGMALGRENPLSLALDDDACREAAEAAFSPRVAAGRAGGGGAADVDDAGAAAAPQWLQWLPAPLAAAVEAVEASAGALSRGLADAAGPLVPPPVARAWAAVRGFQLPRLSVQEAARASEPWPMFLHGGGKVGTGRRRREREAATAPYALPATLELLQQRLEDNLLAYVGNYVKVLLACMLMCVLVSPKAFAGGLLCLVAYALIERRRAAALLDESIRQDTLDTEERAALALAWLASVLTGLTPRLFAGLLLGAAIALLHAVLRDGAPAVRKQRRRWWGR